MLTDNEDNSRDNEYNIGDGIDINFEIDKQLINKNNKIKKPRVRSVYNLEHFYLDDINTIEISLIISKCF